MNVTANEISSAAAVVALVSVGFTGLGLTWARRAANAAEVSAGTDDRS